MDFQSAIGCAPLLPTVCPLIMVDNILPESTYEKLLSIMPTEEEWDAAHRQLDAPLFEAGAQPLMKLRAGCATSDYLEELHPEWKEFYPLFEEIDLAVTHRFARDIDTYLRTFCAEVPEIVLASAVLNERSGDWRIEPHLHALNQVLQVMIYMPHSEAHRGDGTIFYGRKEASKRQVRVSDLFCNDPLPLNGSHRAIATFDEEFLDVDRILPYEPNTLIGWVNTPYAIHASPVTYGRRRRYSFSCACLATKPVIEDVTIML